MSQRRIAAEAAELLHLEVECPECHAIAVLPFVRFDQNALVQSGQIALEQCLWCQKPSARQCSQEIKTLVDTIRALRSAPNPPLLRFVFQDNPGQEK